MNAPKLLQHITVYFKILFFKQ